MKGSRLFLSSLVTSLFLTGIYDQNASAQDSSNWVKKALGIYQSQIFSGNNLVSGTTEFSENSDGYLKGIYMMNDQGKSVLGKLSKCQATQVQVMRCVWNDKYGTGTLEVTFSEDFLSFNGYWGEEGRSEPVFWWSGSR